MKRRIRRTAATNNRGIAGGITLETALTMPVFLLFAMFLIGIVQTAVIAMALHGALSQTVRQTAQAWYPISLSTDEIRASEANQAIERANGKLADAGETIGAYADYLPSPLKDWAQFLQEGNLSVEQQSARSLFRQLALSFADLNVLRENRLSIANVELPDEQDRSRAFLTVRATYRLPFKVPFTEKPLILSESARERAWIGGSPSSARLASDATEPLGLAFVSLEPNPVRRGRKATLVLRARPGQSVDLSVLYKSGQSQAKHLGTAVADRFGTLTWTWLVSGNTTPGEWQWVAKTNGGAWTRPFQVASGKSH